MFLTNLLNRQIHGRTNRTALRQSVFHNISLDDSRHFKIHRNEHVTGIDVDRIDQRYILVATGLGHIEIFDLHTRPTALPTFPATATTTTTTTTAPPPVLKPLASLPRAHNRMVSSVQWYPVDTGLFISSCRNGLINLWDTNQQKVVWKLDAGTPINDATMSPIATAHLLIAAAAQDSTVRLCDPRSGCSTHILAGHSAEVSTLAWSPLNPFTLASGSHDSGIRLWDIRQSGRKSCIMSLNQHRTKGTTTTTKTPTSSSSTSSSSTSSSSTSSSSSTTTTAPASARPSSSRPFKRQRQDTHHHSTQSTFGAARANLTAQERRAAAALAHNGKVTCVTYTHDGRYLMSAGTDDQMRCWDVRQQGINVLTHYTGFTNPCPMKSWMLVLQPSTSNSKNSMVVHPIGKRDGKDGNIGMFDMRSGQLVQTLKGHWERSNCGCYVDKGGEIEMLTGGADGTVMTWKYGGGGGGSASDSNKNGTGEDMENENEEDSHMMSRVWAGGGGGEDNWSD